MPSPPSLLARVRRPARTARRAPKRSRPSSAARIAPRRADRAAARTIARACACGGASRSTAARVAPCRRARRARSWRATSSGTPSDAPRAPPAAASRSCSASRASEAPPSRSAISWRSLTRADLDAVGDAEAPRLLAQRWLRGAAPAIHSRASGDLARARGAARPARGGGPCSARGARRRRSACRAARHGPREGAGSLEAVRDRHEPLARHAAAGASSGRPRSRRSRRAPRRGRAAVAAPRAEACAGRCAARGVPAAVEGHHVGNARAGAPPPSRAAQRRCARTARGSRPSARLDGPEHRRREQVLARSARRARGAPARRRSARRSGSPPRWSVVSTSVSTPGSRSRPATSRTCVSTPPMWGAIRGVIWRTRALRFLLTLAPTTGGIGDRVRHSARPRIAAARHAAGERRERRGRGLGRPVCRRRCGRTRSVRAPPGSSSSAANMPAIHAALPPPVSVEAVSPIIIGLPGRRCWVIGRSRRRRCSRRSATGRRGVVAVEACPVDVGAPG